MHECQSNDSPKSPAKWNPIKGRQTAAQPGWESKQQLLVENISLTLARPFLGHEGLISSHAWASCCSPWAWERERERRNMHTKQWRKSRPVANQARVHMHALFRRPCSDFFKALWYKNWVPIRKLPCHANWIFHEKSSGCFLDPFCRSFVPSFRLSCNRFTPVQTRKDHVQHAIIACFCRVGEHS